MNELAVERCDACGAGIFHEDGFVLHRHDPDCPYGQSIRFFALLHQAHPELVPLWIAQRDAPEDERAYAWGRYLVAVEAIAARTPVVHPPLPPLDGEAR